MSLLGGFGRSVRMRGWAVLDGLRSKELNHYNPELNLEGHCHYWLDLI